ncbi:hypothetical protein SEMRO_2653_G333790.1 [Seminavis robusta]|uniref:Uncharacterized protein n=1 Tax=Seminavis robusta TaxID=568900 RepID=A0A9N8HYV0_9STRA|nr:hypothetical protein SEMRO_2653_G333790.1 [Seminavis robusta]|eukprot:Sro2653_g333790.1 n/a (382) ;mRNA; r:9475-10620
MSGRPPGKKKPPPSNPYHPAGKKRSGKKSTKKKAPGALATMSTAGRIEDKVKEWQRKQKARSTNTVGTTPSSSSSSTTPGSSSKGSSSGNRRPDVARKISSRYPKNIRSLTLHTLLSKIDTSMRDDEILTSPAGASSKTVPVASVGEIIREDIKQLAGTNTDSDDIDEFLMTQEEKELIRLEDEVSVALLVLSNGDLGDGRKIKVPGMTLEMWTSLDDSQRLNRNRALAWSYYDPKPDLETYFKGQKGGYPLPPVGEQYLLGGIPEKYRLVTLQKVRVFRLAWDSTVMSTVSFVRPWAGWSLTELHLRKEAFDKDNQWNGLLCVELPSLTNDDIEDETYRLASLPAGGKVVTCDPSFLSAPMKTVFRFEWWQHPPKPHEWW